jgi:hypothetical protein
MMRRLILAAALLTITLADLPGAQAGTRIRQNRRNSGSSTTYSTGGNLTVPPPPAYRAQRGGFLERLIEFERRKNEFLFGRFRP